MGWASGSEIAEDVWTLVRRYVPENKKKAVAKKIIDIFENNDCDTIEEAESLCKAAGREPEDFED